MATNMEGLFSCHFLMPEMFFPFISYGWLLCFSVVLLGHSPHPLSPYQLGATFLLYVSLVGILLQIYKQAVAISLTEVKAPQRQVPCLCYSLFVLLLYF